MTRPHGNSSCTRHSDDKIIGIFHLFLQQKDHIGSASLKSIARALALIPKMLVDTRQYFSSDVLITCFSRNCIYLSSKRTDCTKTHKRYTKDSYYYFPHRLTEYKEVGDSSPFQTEIRPNLDPQKDNKETYYCFPLALLNSDNICY